MSDPKNTQDLLTEWQQTVDQGLKAWQALSVPQAAAAMQIWQQAMAQGVAAWTQDGQGNGSISDAVGAWKQFTDQALDLWSKALDQAMASEAVATLMGRSMEETLNLLGPLRRNYQGMSEDMFRTLNVPSRKQVTRLAAGIVAVDGRMEDIEERLDRIEAHLTELLEELNGGNGPEHAEASAEKSTGKASSKRRTHKEGHS